MCKMMILIVFACSCSAHLSKTSAAVAGDCSVPNAIAGDGVDDRAAIQSALTANGCAYLPTGVYDIDSIPFTPPARRPYMMLTVSSANFYGDGPGTVLHFRGSAQGADWQGIRLAGTGAQLHDLSIDTADITDTDEQTHAVHVLGPTSAPSVYRVTIDHPDRGQPGGDCIQVVGYATNQLVTGMRIHDMDFVRCDRSGVAIHSGAVDFAVTDSHFRATGDQDIDAEGSGGSSGWTLARNTFDTGVTHQGDFAIQLQLVTDVKIIDSTFNGRGIFVYQSDNVEIAGITLVRATGPSGIGVIDVQKDSSYVNIHNSDIRRTAAAGAGYLIRAAPHGSGTPDHLTVADNTLTQEATGDVVNTTGMIGMNVLRNHVTYSGTASGATGLLANGSSTIRTTGLVVDSNTWTGPLRNVVAVAGSYAGCGTLATGNNVANGPLGGIYCSGVYAGSGVTGPITSTNDSWPAPVCGAAGFVQIIP